MSENTEIVTKRTFEENMMDRIRKDIGDLMPDEALKQIIERGIEQAFFQIRKDNSGNFHKVDQEPLLVEVVRDLVEVRVRKAVDEWVQENADRISEQIEAIFLDGMMQRVVARLDERFKVVHEEVLQKISETFKTGNFPFEQF